jgi:hypothetical protein
LLVLGSALLAATPAAGVAPPALKFESAAVVATGVSPGGHVVWFSVAREPQGFISRVVRREEVVEDLDKDGIVTFPVEEGVPFKSIWVAVDLASGHFAIAGPPGYPLNEIPFPAGGVRPVGGFVRQLRNSRGVAEILVVRPGVGAWGLSVGDGGEGDEDGANDGVVLADLWDAYAIGTGPPVPEQLSPKDVLVMVDPQQMEFYAVSFVR